MPPGQTIPWMTLVVLLCLTSAWATDKKKNDSTDLAQDKQPENKTGFELLGERCNCDCDPTPCYNPTVPTPKPIFPMLLTFDAGYSDCCQILEDAVKDLNETWTDLNSTAITLISVEKVANRCSYYDDVLKPCRFQCKLYPIMCHDPKQFVKELKCLKERPRQWTANEVKSKETVNGHEVEQKSYEKGLYALSACGKPSMELANTIILSPNISSVICGMGRKFLECAAKQSQADCGPIAKALYMNGYVWDDVTLAKDSVNSKTESILNLENNLNWTEVDPDCFEYINYRINSTFLGSSSLHNTACGMLIAATLVVCMLPLEITTTLAQHRPKAPLWIVAVLILGLATGSVLSDDPNVCAAHPCTTPQCTTGHCSSKSITIELIGIEKLCCQPFYQLSVIDKVFREKVPPTGEPTSTVEPIYVDVRKVDILLAEETLKTRCGFYTESLKDCQKKCPLYGLICNDVPKFLEGLECYHDKLEKLKFQVEAGRLEKGIKEWEANNPPNYNRSAILCEEEYNITQNSVPENDSNIVICANRLKYWLCVERNFNETCPGIGAWLGLMNFFNMNDRSKAVYYNVPDSIEDDCLLYANYIGKHTSPPGSSSPWNAAMSLGMVVAAIISGALGHRILMNFR